MKKNRIYSSLIAIAIALTIFTNPVYTQSTKLENISPAVNEKISIDLRDMDIIDVLKFLSIKGKLNIVSASDVKGTVNLLLDSVTVGDAFEVILAINNLAYEIEGNIIKVMTAEGYKKVYGSNFYDRRETRVVYLKYASAESVGAILGNVKSDVGKIVFNNATGMLVLIDTPEKIARMLQIIKREELPTVERVLPTVTETFKLQYARAEDIKDEIVKTLTKEIGTMRADNRTNIFVITDLPHNMERIKQVIKAFDRKPRQVFIEAKIIEVALSDTFKWGIDWKQLSWIAKEKLSFLSEVSLPVTLESGGGALTIETLYNDDLTLVLEALDATGETKIISNPHIAVTEGETATIEVVEEEPYQEGSTEVSTGGTSSTVYQIAFKKVGVILEVTPTINEEGFISMFIKPEVISLSDWYDYSVGEGPLAEKNWRRVPVVKTANAETTVMVKDGVTIIIAGLIKENKTKTVNKIPILGDIPLLGKLFSNISDDIRRTETIIFLTPRIITGEQPFLLLKDEQKEIKDTRE